jgi:DNA-binding CsgD family transcriptional regulator
MPAAQPPLTPRRREIALLLTEGWTLGEIARMLTITPEAVADDVEHLLRRLDRTSQTEVASWAGAPVRRLWIVRPEPDERPESGERAMPLAPGMERSGYGGPPRRASPEARS